MEESERGESNFDTIMFLKERSSGSSLERSRVAFLAAFLSVGAEVVMPVLKCMYQNIWIVA